MNACREQATRIDPQMRSPEAQEGLFKLRSSRGSGGDYPSECSAGKIAEKLFRVPVGALYCVRPSLKILPNPLRDGGE
jgi:hypothetical protein